MVGVATGMLSPTNPDKLSDVCNVIMYIFCFDILDASTATSVSWRTSCVAACFFKSCLIVIAMWLLYNKQHLHHLVFLTNSVISKRSIWTLQIVTRAVSSHLKPAINSIVSQATLLSGESLMAPQKWRNTFIGLLKTSQHQGSILLSTLL